MNNQMLVCIADVTLQSNDIDLLQASKEEAEVRGKYRHNQTRRMSGDFMYVLQDLIPEAFSGQKYHVNRGPILNGHGHTVI